MGVVDCQKRNVKKKKKKTGYVKTRKNEEKETIKKS